MTRALVTGGLGFVGRHLVSRLVREGATVAVVDALVPDSGGCHTSWPGVRVLVEDLRTCGALESIVAEADVVFHLAGLTSHVGSMERPADDLAHNVEATLALAEACRRARTRARVVFTSTRSVYGMATRSPVDESHPAVPLDVNGVHKLAAEQLLAVYAAAHGVQLARLRLSNVYGPGQSGHGFVGAFLARGRARRAIEIYGDGRQARDLTFVDDAVDAILRAPDGLWNVGGAATTVREVAEIVARHAGVSVVEVPWPAERVAIEVGGFSIDDGGFRRATGWVPATALDAGLARALAR